MSKGLRFFAREVLARYCKSLKTWHVTNYQRVYGVGHGMLSNSCVGGVLMKITRVILTVCVLLVGAGAAFANTIDPRISAGGSGSCASDIITSLTETFTITSSEIGCPVDFTNCIGGSSIEGRCSLGEETTTLFHEDVNLPPSAFTPPGSLTCASVEGSPFGGTATPFPDACRFSAPPDSSGLTPGSIFSLEFDDVGGGSFIPPFDITLAQTILPVPEPATIVLLGVGLFALIVGSKKAGLLKTAATRAF